MLICRTCAVEYDEPTPRVCPICADERQYVPEDGQAWRSLAELTADGQLVIRHQLEPDLIGLRTEPEVGIGQQSLLVRTPHGCLLWDPIGYLDDETVAAVAETGPVLAIAASHPHMFGVQVEWSRQLGGVPVLVCEPDAEWLGRSDESVVVWSGVRDITDGLRLHQIGGHFPGSAVAHWPAGAGGRGVLLASDTIGPNPDRQTVTFMRSYPNRIPLSAAVTERIAAALEPLAYDRIYGNFNNVIGSDGREVVRRSAARHAAWARGEFDQLT